VRKYPNRDGQRSEDLGREPYVFELEIPLFADIDPSHYPTMAEQLRAILDDPEDGLEYRDHELGTMPVSIGPWTSDIDAKMRDGVVFRIQLTEDQVDVTSQRAVP
jgi:prophage DNA circulation protein